MLRAVDPVFGDRHWTSGRRSRWGCSVRDRAGRAEKRANPPTTCGRSSRRARSTSLSSTCSSWSCPVAGSETTRNAIGTGSWRCRPAGRARRAAPGPVVGGTATEEILRWASPVTDFARTATRGTPGSAASTSWPASASVSFYPSANRNEREFADPFRFDIRRTPNHHVSFGGGGAHYCLGASLARTELQVMIGALLRRFAAIEIIGDPVWMSAGPAATVGVAVQSLFPSKWLSFA